MIHGCTELSPTSHLHAGSTLGGNLSRVVSHANPCTCNWQINVLFFPSIFGDRNEFSEPSHVVPKCL